MREKSIAMIKDYLHIIIVAGIFITLFAVDYINFSSFISIGFFSILLTDHIIDGIKEKIKSRKNSDKEAPNKPVEGVKN